MIHQKITKKIDLFDQNVYRQALTTIEFTAVNSSVFVIDKGTLFTISSEYLIGSGDYKVTVTGYEFSPHLDRADNPSPLTVQSTLVQTVSAWNYTELKYNIDNYTDSMKKNYFEFRMNENPDVKECRNYIKDLASVRNSNLLKAAEANDRIRSFNSTGFFSPLRGIAHAIQDSPISQFLIVYHVTATMVDFVLLCKTLTSLSHGFNPLTLIIEFIILICGVINTFNSPVNALSIYERLIGGIAGAFREFMSGEKDSPEEKYINQYESYMNEIHLTDEKQKQTLESLNSRLPEIAGDIFRLQNTPDNSMNSIALPDSDTLSPANFRGTYERAASPYHETETRSPEELRGNYERVAFPVYEKKSGSTKKVDLTKH